MEDTGLLFGVGKPNARWIAEGSVFVELTAVLFSSSTASMGLLSSLSSAILVVSSIGSITCSLAVDSTIVCCFSRSSVEAVLSI